MVLISIHPFALRKIFLIILLSLCFSALSLADPVLMVHRCTGSPEHPGAAKARPWTAQQHLDPQAALDTTSQFGPLGSLDSTGNQAEWPLIEPGRIVLPTTLPSSAFRRAMCDLRPTNFQAGITAWPNLTLPDEN